LFKLMTGLRAALQFLAKITRQHIGRAARPIGEIN